MCRLLIVKQYCFRVWLNLVGLILLLASLDNVLVLGVCHTTNKASSLYGFTSVCIAFRKSVEALMFIAVNSAVEANLSCNHFSIVILCATTLHMSGKLVFGLKPRIMATPTASVQTLYLFNARIKKQSRRLKWVAALSKS